VAVAVTVRVCAGWLAVLVSVVVSVLAVAVPDWPEFEASVELDDALASFVPAFAAALDAASFACEATVPDPPEAQATADNVAKATIPTRLSVARNIFSAGDPGLPGDRLWRKRTCELR
jgi:hypothetical protein